MLSFKKYYKESLDDLIKDIKTDNLGIPDTPVLPHAIKLFKHNMKVLHKSFRNDHEIIRTWHRTIEWMHRQNQWYGHLNVPWGDLIKIDANTIRKIMSRMVYKGNRIAKPIKSRKI